MKLFLLFVAFLCCFSLADCSGDILSFSLDRYRVSLNGRPHFLKGVVYSPSPAGSSPLWTSPQGDFFLPQFSDLWQRDFPLIKSMGANCIRISGWTNDGDHSNFLNFAHSQGLGVLISFSFDAAQFPIVAEWQRQNLLGTFKWQISKYLNHPAVIGWSFGSEVNGNWRGILKNLNEAFQCGWSDPCFGAKADWCAAAEECVYQRLFELLNTAAVYGKQLMGSSRPHLILSSFADVDFLPSRIEKFEKFAPDIDAWGIQIYRGKNFGSGDADFLAEYSKVSQKPLIVTEFGVDAYNDPCGNSETSPCYNTHENELPGYGEDQEQQAEWILALAEILTSNSSATGSGPVAGGFVYEWSDEWWKASANVRGCYGPIPYGKPGFEPGQCEYRSHVDCPFKDLWWQSLCGFPSAAQFDGYANQAWFGLVKIWPQPGFVDKVFPRLAYRALQSHWAGSSTRLWFGLMIACVVASAAIAIWMIKKWRERVAQLKSLGIRSDSLTLSQAIGVVHEERENEGTPLIKKNSQNEQKI